MVLEDVFEKRFYAYMLALVSSQIIATTNAYLFHKYVTFKSRLKGRRMIIEFLRFCSTYVITFSLSLTLLPFFVEGFHIDPKLAGAITALICITIGYIGHSRFSFNES